jgi:hypothetical protein
MTEKLVAAAIERDGKVLERGFKSHFQLRSALDPDDPDPRYGKPGDIDGFMTSTGKFVTRAEAVPIAVAAKQIHPTWGTGSHRPLLSSDITW